VDELRGYVETWLKTPWGRVSFMLVVFTAASAAMLLSGFSVIHIALYFITFAVIMSLIIRERLTDLTDRVAKLERDITYWEDKDK
jgi:hypothetical protein